MTDASFLSRAIVHFFVAFGVVLGASLMAGCSSLLTWQPPGPVVTMRLVAAQVKIWAIVVAVGGTIDPIRVIEWNMTQGDVTPAFKQLFLIVCAFLGAHCGTTLIRTLCPLENNG